jgi:hypothetical protein
MAMEHATRNRLTQLVNIELMANPGRVVEYQAFADDTAANLRQRYALKD